MFLRASKYVPDFIEKSPMRKHRAFFWLGWRDSNPRDAGVKVLCLTAWRQPNIRKICFRDLVKVPIAKTMGTLNYFVGWGVGFEPTVFRATI